MRRLGDTIVIFTSLDAVVGLDVGRAVGGSVGAVVGDTDGAFVGRLVGAREGVCYSEHHGLSVPKALSFCPHVDACLDGTYSRL
jgi:hypothetical protein